MTEKETLRDALGRPIKLADTNPIGKTDLDGLRQIMRDIRTSQVYRDGVGVLGVEIRVSKIEDAIREIEAARKKLEAAV